MKFSERFGLGVIVGALFAGVVVALDYSIKSSIGFGLMGFGVGGLFDLALAIFPDNIKLDRELGIGEDDPPRQPEPPRS